MKGLFNAKQTLYIHGTTTVVALTGAGRGKEKHVVNKYLLNKRNDSVVDVLELCQRHR